MAVGACAATTGSSRYAARTRARPFSDRTIATATASTRASSSTRFAEAATTMAHKTVQFIIGRILTDEELREKFLVAPVETLSAFRESGLELTDAETEALVNTDR